jgi:hypothetical protein
MCTWNQCNQKRGTHSHRRRIHRLPQTPVPSILLIDPSSDTYYSSNSDGLLSPLNWSVVIIPNNTTLDTVCISLRCIKEKYFHFIHKLIYMLWKHKHVLQNNRSSLVLYPSAAWTQLPIRRSGNPRHSRSSELQGASLLKFFYLQNYLTLLKTATFSVVWSTSFLSTLSRTPF